MQSLNPCINKTMLLNAVSLSLLTRCINTMRLVTTLKLYSMLLKHFAQYHYHLSNSIIKFLSNSIIKFTINNLEHNIIKEGRVTQETHFHPCKK